jgi:hypothetical protein
MAGGRRGSRHRWRRRCCAVPRRQLKTGRKVDQTPEPAAGLHALCDHGGAWQEAPSASPSTVVSQWWWSSRSSPHQTQRRSRGWWISRPANGAAKVFFPFFRITDSSAQCTYKMRLQLSLFRYIYSSDMMSQCIGLICAYISVKQMGEEHDEEELYGRVDPNVSSCHCNDIWIMDPLQHNQACNYVVF